MNRIYIAATVAGVTLVAMLLMLAFNLDSGELFGALLSAFSLSSAALAGEFVVQKNEAGAKRRRSSTVLPPARAVDLGEEDTTPEKKVR